MQKHRVYIIHNPVAGTSDPEDVRRVLQDRLTEKGWEYDRYETTGEENMRGIVQQAVEQGFGCIWAAGGDGTVSLVADALVGGEVPMGIVPIGTGNALARELEIPLDPAGAADLLLGETQIRKLDALRIKEQYFVLAVSVGISALTMAETARAQKRRLGRLAYLINGLRLILSRSLWPFQVAVDGRRFRVRAAEVIAANAGIIGVKPLKWGADVRPDDGRVDLCYIGSTSPTGIIAVIGALLLGRQNQVEALQCLAAHRQIEITSRRKMPVQADGEPIGYTPARIEVVPDALPVLTPRSSG